MVTLYEQQVNMNCQVFMLHSWLIVVNTPSPPPRICSSSFSSIGFVNFKMSSLIVYSSLKCISCPNRLCDYCIIHFSEIILLVIFPSLNETFPFLDYKINMLLPYKLSTIYLMLNIWEID